MESVGTPGTGAYCLVPCRSSVLAVSLAAVETIMEAARLIRLPLCPRPVTALCPYRGGFLPILGLADDHGARTVLCGLANDDGSLAYAGDAAVPPFLSSWLAGALSAFIADASPFARPIPLRSGLRWLRPKLVAIVEHDGEDPRSLGDARFRALRFDARVDECRAEEPLEMPSGPPSGSGERPRLVLLQSLPFS